MGRWGRVEVTFADYGWVVGVVQVVQVVQLVQVAQALHTVASLQGDVRAATFAVNCVQNCTQTLWSTRTLLVSQIES